MFMYKRVRYHIASIFIFALPVLIGACSSNENGDGNLTDIAPNIILYLTQTPTATSNPLGNSLNSSQIPSPAVTAIIYTVVDGDNFTVIAARFNIAVESLIAANPGIDPQFISVGAELIIPAQEGSSVGILPSPTPAEVISNLLSCFPTASGGLWCLLLIENDLPTPIENLAAQILLYSNEGKLVASQEAGSSLNILPSGKRIPLVAYFEAPVPAWESAQSQILSAVLVPDDGVRYLPVVANDIEIEIGDLGLSAQVKGQVSLLEGSTPANLVWVMAVAYGQDGLPVGIRRWESVGKLFEGENLDFELQVFSLGPAIISVEMLFEARP